jgi:hypothetical protein
MFLATDVRRLCYFSSLLSVGRKLVELHQHNKQCTDPYVGYRSVEIDANNRTKICERRFQMKVAHIQ